MGHDVSRRVVIAEGDEAWRGDIWCNCGWTFVVDNHPTEESAAISLQAQWLHHSGAI